MKFERMIIFIGVGFISLVLLIGLALDFTMAHAYFTIRAILVYSVLCCSRLVCARYRKESKSVTARAGEGAKESKSVTARAGEGARGAIVWDYPHLL